jgi:TIR domain
MSVSVFVSYSHDDVALVTPIVKLLRLNKSLVFQDLDSIELGKRWREQAGRALTEAHLVVLFWCVHSSHSTEVEGEYRSALKTGKDLLPVLLDATPLPAELSEFQWIDFRGTVGGNHANTVILPGAPVSPSPEQSRPWLLRYSLFTTVAVFLAIVTLSFWSLHSLKDMPPPTSSAPEVLPLPEPTSSSPFHNEPYLFLALIVVIVIAVGAFLWRRRRSRVTSEYPIAKSSDESQRQMAAEIEAEILRRGTSGRN